MFVKFMIFAIEIFTKYDFLVLPGSAKTIFMWRGKHLH